MRNTAQPSRSQSGATICGRPHLVRLGLVAHSSLVAPSSTTDKLEVYPPQAAPEATRACPTFAPMISRVRGETGSLLVTAALSSAVIGILIGGMLTFISTEYEFEVRGHRWTQALHLGEAGVELAFAEFNNYYLTGQGGFANERGWYYAGSGQYYRYIPNYYNANGERVGYIYSYVNGVGSASPYLFAYGGCTTIPDGPIVYRAIEARLKNSARFPCAMVAKQTIDMNGNNVTTDSYDSTDPAKSTNGQFDSAKRQANGDIASNDTVTNTVDLALGNANIYGRVLLRPSGSVTMGPNGSIGPTLVEASRATSVAQAQANGWVRNDFQVDIPDVTLPTGATTWPAMPATATISSGDYKASSIGGSRTITGSVRLYLTGNSAFTGNEGITVASNSTLVIYTAGSFDIGGNGVVNQNGKPINCQIYGLNTCTDIKYSGNAVYTGTIYAPYAALAIKGGGSAGEVAGSFVAKSFTMTGTTVFHYDEMLLRQGPGVSYNINSWKSYRWTGNQWVSD